jgi:CBS-domain-containing membrane protein
MQVKDIMTVNVVSVSQDTPIHEVVGLLLKYRISAVPVIDRARKVVGIVSEGDLLRPEGTSCAGRSVRGGWRRSSPARQWPTKRRGVAPPAV